MTTEPETSNRDTNNEDREALLTAYALGQLSGDEQAAVEAILAEPGAAAARQHVAELSQIAAALAAGHEHDLPERSADLRLAVLAAVARAGAPITPALPSTKRGRGVRWIVAAGGLVVSVPFLLALMLPAVQSSREAARRTAAVLDKRHLEAGGQAYPARAVPGEGAWSDAHLGPASREQYNRFTENRFLTSADHPLSTFSIDVDTASYANTRRFLMAGQRPPRDAVRIEELVNYFSYDDPAPTGDVPFSVNVEAADCPWRAHHKIVRIGLAGRDVARDQRPAGNLVFLVDVSGSMADADKLPLVQQSLLMLVDELTESDRVALVTYAGNAGLVLPSTRGDQKEKIGAAIESLSSGGSTHGSAGITLAYEQAAERFIEGGANRVILATDGDLNVGVTSDEALVALITRMAKGGTFLTVLGFGQGNLQDEKMEKLADCGNGVYAYIDSVREARKVLVEQLTGSTITIAKDVKIQVEFNPARVASYRLLGYENRALADRDFRDDKKDAGEIGAGHGVTALYEIELVGDGDHVESSGAEPLKYQPQPKRETTAKPAPTADEDVSRELLTVKLRFKQPDGDTSQLLEVPLADAGGRFDDASTNLRFASAVAAFGMLLRGSEHAGEATLPMVAKIAAGALGADAGGYRAEFLDLVRRAEQTQ